MGAKILVVPIFPICPAVKCFIHNQYSQFITSVQQRVSRCVMCSPDGITSHFFQLFHLPVDSVTVCRCAERPLVMVHTHAFELHILTVQAKTCICIKIKIAEAKCCHISIFHLAIYQNLCLYIIQVRSFTAPERRFIYRSLLFHRSFRACRHRYIFADRSGHFFTLRIQNSCTYCCIYRSVSIVLHLSYHVYGNIAILLCLQVRSRYIRSIFRHMYVIRNY